MAAIFAAVTLGGSDVSVPNFCFSVNFSTSFSNP